MPDNPSHPRVTKEAVIQYIFLKDKIHVEMKDMTAVLREATRLNLESLKKLLEDDFKEGLRTSGYLDIMKRYDWYCKKHKVGHYARG